MDRCGSCMPSSRHLKSGSFLQGTRPVPAFGSLLVALKGDEQVFEVFAVVVTWPKAATEPPKSLPHRLSRGKPSP